MVKAVEALAPSWRVANRIVAERIVRDFESPYVGQADGPSGCGGEEEAGGWGGPQRHRQIIQRQPQHHFEAVSDRVPVERKTTRSPTATSPLAPVTLISHGPTQLRFDAAVEAQTIVLCSFHSPGPRYHASARCWHHDLAAGSFISHKKDAELTGESEVANRSTVEAPPPCEVLICFGILRLSSPLLWHSAASSSRSSLIGKRHRPSELSGPISRKRALNPCSGGFCWSW